MLANMTKTPFPVSQIKLIVWEEILEQPTRPKNTAVPHSQFSPKSIVFMKLGISFLFTSMLSLTSMVIRTYPVQVQAKWHGSILPCTSYWHLKNKSTNSLSPIRQDYSHHRRRSKPMERRVVAETIKPRRSNKRSLAIKWSFL